MIEQKIYDHLRQNQDLMSFLATYDGIPAVFLQEAPADTDKRWDGEQYGRMIFGIDYSSDPERTRTASLWVDVYARKEGPDPEEVAPVVVEILNNRFFADNEEVIALTWKSTDGFQETRNDKLINGATMNFEVIYFPRQYTTTPDPIYAINRWTKERLPNAYVIGIDNLPDSWSTRENPTIYWRISNIRPGTIYPDTYNCTWHDADLNGHFMIDNANTRLTVCKALVDELAGNTVIMMDDNSPMFVMRIAYTASSDAVKQGQITVTADYGVLRQYPYVEPITDINVSAN